MLDSDLAQHYQTETRTFNQTVRRNIKKFPEDFMFQVSKTEFEVLESQIIITKREVHGGRRKLPLVFTEQGVGMLSCVFDNDRAIQVGIVAIRAFTQVRQVPDGQNDLMKKVEYLEYGFQEFKQIFARFESKFDRYLESVQYSHRQLLSEKLPSEITPLLAVVNPEVVSKIEKIQETVVR
jgi:hypothetical protein